MFLSLKRKLDTVQSFWAPPQRNLQLCTLLSKRASLVEQAQQHNSNMIWHCYLRLLPEYHCDRPWLVYVKGRHLLKHLWRYHTKSSFQTKRRPPPPPMKPHILDDLSCNVFVHLQQIPECCTIFLISMFYRATRLYQLYDFSAQSSETGSAAVLLSARLSRWVEPSTSQFIHQVVKF